MGITGQNVTERTTVKEHEIRTNVKQNRFMFLLENGFRLIQLKSAKEPSFLDWPNANHIGDPDPDGRYPGDDSAGDDPKAILEKVVKQAEIRFHKKKNVGAVLPPGVVVIDIDTKPDADGKTGLDQFKALLAAHGGMELQVFLTSTYSVKTGGGGYHVFFKYDESKHLSASLKRAGCPSVDVLHGVRFVVAPGSGHPSGGIYEQVERSPLEIRPLPQWLADLVFTDLDDLRGLEDTGQADSLCNVMSPSELSTLLAALDPVQYRDYGSWFALLAACHHATGGDVEAMAIFGDWSAQDPDFADEARAAVETKWPTVHSRRQRSKALATVRSLLTAVGRAVAEARAVNKLLGQSEGPAFSAAFETVTALRKKLVESDLQPVAARTDKEAFLDWLMGTEGKWAGLSIEDKRKVFERAAQFDDLEWPTIADAISHASYRELSKKKAELAIRNERRRAEKVKKAVEKQERADSERTTPMLVELIAEQSIAKVFGDKGNLGWASNEIIYHYKDGVWVPIEKSQVEKASYEIASALVDTKKEKSKTLAQFSSLASDTIRLKTLGEASNLYARKQLPNCINLKNKTVWFAPGKPPEFRPHRREDYLTTQLPYDYDPNATCPGFLTMLDQAFVEIEKEFSTEEKNDFKRHFFEVVGYMIQPNKNHPLAWIWIGGGKNGKSRITKILAKLVGESAWKKGDIRDFNPDKNPHMLHSLENQLVLLDDDAKKGVTLDDGMIKKICESSDILVNPKNKNAYMIRLQVTPLILTNHALCVDDLSDGMLRKLQVAEFKANLMPLETSELPDQVEANEMPGILNLAIQGLSRLRDRGKFEVPKCAGEFKRRYLVKANVIYYFWDSVIKTEALGNGTDVKAAYGLYKEYVLHNLTGRAVSFPSFCDDIENCGAVIENGKIKDLELTKPDCWVSD
jgi:P4 family phage/plasmid primase-like protien